MARRWSLSLIVLLALPIAAPATAPIPGEARWDTAPALVYRTRPGDTVSGIAEKALGDPAQAGVLMAANGLLPSQTLRTNQYISIPSSMLRRDMLKARITGFAGNVRLGDEDGPRLAVGSEITEGDIVSIGANSFVTLDMGMAGRVTLPSQSRLRIAALHRVALTGQVIRRLEPLPQARVWQTGRRESMGNASIPG